MEKIGLGGGCHWCTEAVFLSLRGVVRVQQGWIAAKEKQDFSEAIIVHYHPGEINLYVLLAIHLQTHSSTANHSMRSKYRSAVYTFSEEQKSSCATILSGLQAAFDQPVVTEILSFHDFRSSPADEWHYYYSNPSKPFCQTHIQPKMKILLEQFSAHADTNKITGNDY